MSKTTISAQRPTASVPRSSKPSIAAGPAETRCQTAAMSNTPMQATSTQRSWGWGDPRPAHRNTPSSPTQTHLRYLCASRHGPNLAHPRQPNSRSTLRLMPRQVFRGILAQWHHVCATASVDHGSVAAHTHAHRHQLSGQLIQGCGHFIGTRVMIQ